MVLKLFLFQPMFQILRRKILLTLKNVVEVYGEHSAKALERMTHNERPWLDARGDLSPEARSNSIIPKEKMGDFYRKAYQEADGEE